MTSLEQLNIDTKKTQLLVIQRIKKNDIHLKKMYSMLETASSLQDNELRLEAFQEGILYFQEAVNLSNQMLNALAHMIKSSYELNAKPKTIRKLKRTANRHYHKIERLKNCLDELTKMYNSESAQAW